MVSFLCTVLEKIGPKLGFAGVRRLGALLGFLMWYSLPARRRLAIEAIMLHLDKPHHEAKQIARASFTHNCRSFLELFLVPLVDQQFLKTRLNIADTETYNVLQNYEGSVVGVTAHLGAWEMLAGILGEDVGRAHSLIVVRKQKHPVINRLIANLRSARGAKVVDHRNAVFTVLKALRRNALAAFLVDHNCKRSEALFLPFLQKIAAVNMGPAMLAVRAKSAIVPVCMIRETDGSYTYHVAKALLPEDLTGTVEEKVAQVTAFYNSAVQEFIRTYPEQWFWMHKRWKTRPEEEKESA